MATLQPLWMSQALQSYPAYYLGGVPLNSMSDWGWHSFANTEGFKPEDTQKEFNLHGRPSVYAVEYKTECRNKARPPNISV